MNRTANLKRLLLCSASVALAQLGLAPAYAADPSATVAVGPVPNVQVSAGSAFPAQQDSSAAVSTSTNANQIVVTALAGNGGGSGIFTNSTHGITASSTANTLSLTGSLTSLASPDGLVFGSLQTETGVVRSISQGNVIGITLDNLQSGSFTGSGNSVRANTTLNNSSAVTSGSQAIGYLSTATQNALALITGSESNRTVQATGTVAMSAAQSANVTAGIEDAAAIVGGSGTAANRLFLSSTSQTNNALAASLSLSTNTLAATFVGNQLLASPRMVAADGTSEGSIAVANSQSYDGNASAEQATNSGSSIGVTVTAANGAFNTLDKGAVAASGNVITASTTGNSATDAVTTATNQSYVGPGSPNRATISLGSASTVAQVSGEIANASSQFIGTAPSSTPVIAARTSDAAVTANLQGATGSQVTLATNSFTATTTGNLVDTGVRTTGTASTIDSSIALGSSQIIDAAAVSATVTNSVVQATIGRAGAPVTDSTVRVATNNTQARAFGQQATQAIAATTIAAPLGNRTAALSTDGLVTGTDEAASADGAAIIGTYQNNLGPTTVSATVQDGLISLASQDLTGNKGSTLTVTGNAQNSTAVTQIASNLATITGTSTGYSLGIVNAQRVTNAASVVNASTTSTVSLQATQVGSTAPGSSATTDLTLNRNEAVAAGTSATNTVSLTSQRLAIATQNAIAARATYDTAASGTVAFNGGAVRPSVEAAAALLNDQSVDGAVTATGAASARLDVAGGVSSSSLVRNNNNTLTVQAQASVAANTITLTTPVIAADPAASVAPVAALANIQATGTSATSTASMLEADQIEVLTRIGGNVSNSSVAQTANNLGVIADGNRAGNTVTVNSSSIIAAEGGSTAPSAGRTSYLNGTAVVDAAFSVLNAQSAGAPGGSSSVVATLRDPVDDTTYDGAQIVTGLEGNIDSSTVSSTTNVLRALANGNFAGTSTAIGNNLTINSSVVQTTASVGNVQVANSDVSATIGYSGTNVLTANYGLSTPGVLSLSGTNLTVSQAVQLTFAAPLTDREAALLTTLGWTVNPGQASVQIAAGLYNVAGLNLSLDPGSAVPGDEKLRITGFQALAGSANDGGFLISTKAGSTISNSALSMTGNTVTGSSFANTASSALTVNAASIISDGTQLGAKVNSRAAGIEAFADYTVVNNQAAGADLITKSTVANTFGITSGVNTTITNSTITVSTNTQTSVATASYGSNAVTLNGASSDTGGGAPAAIGSMQSNAIGGLTLATSSMDLTAPMGGTGDVVTVSGNRNAAAATINDVRNTLSASGITLGTSGIKAQAGFAATDATIGDLVVSNVQRAVSQSSVTSYAATQIYNQDFVNQGGDTASGGSITISGNATAADAIANRATNTLTATATGLLGSSAALLNDQSNGSNVSASAASAILLGLQSGAGSRIENSVLTASTNSTVATAAGNTATNNLRLSAASLAQSQIAGAGNASTIEGQAVILNAQANSGAIAADSFGSVLNVLPGTSVDGVINNASVVMSGTTVAANAVGNTTDSTITLNLQNSDNPAAVVSAVQTNSGAVTSRVANTLLAVNAVAAPNVGNWQMNGSSITATAVGNSATLTIVAQ